MLHTDSGRVALQMHSLRTIAVEGEGVTQRFAGTLRAPHHFTVDFTQATVERERERVIDN